MSLMSKSVYHVYDVDNIAFGTVVEEKLADRWVWVKVDWVNQKPNNIYKYPSVDPESGWFRIDTVKLFEPDKMISIIESLEPAA